MGSIDEVTLEAPDSAERSFTADSASLADARQFVREVAPPDLASDGDLLLSVSELVTNALLHGRSGFRVRVTTQTATVRVEVFDASPLLPTAKNYGPSAVTGRGLRIVEHLSSAWGVVPVDDGKWVWFEMPRQPEPDAPLIEVRLLALPVAVHARAAAHQDALQRELDLLRRTDAPPDVPVQLLALVDELEQRYGSLNDRPTAELATAMAAGTATVDVTFSVPPDAAPAAERLGELLDRADDYCREGVALMTLATPAESVRYRRWFLGQFLAQIGGAPPTPWPEWLAAHDGEGDEPAPVATAAGPGAGAEADSGDPRAVVRAGAEADSGDPGAVVQADGELDAGRAPQVREELHQLHLHGVDRVTLDLGAVTFIDSYGLSVILAAHARFAEDGARFRMLVPPVLQPTFDLAGLGDVLDLHPTAG